MTNLEIVLLVNVVFLQTIIYALIALQKRLNDRVAKVLELLAQKENDRG